MSRDRAVRNLHLALLSGNRAVIGPALRCYRRAHNLSLDNVAQLSGWSRSLIDYMERGQRWSWDALTDVPVAMEVCGE